LSHVARVSAPGAGEQVAGGEAKVLDRARIETYIIDEQVTASEL